MSCEMTTSLGVYVLGAAEPAERARIEAHLPLCASCRAELIRLAPIPGLLASVPPKMMPRADVFRGARKLSRGRITGIAAALAASVAVAGGAVLGLTGRPAPSPNAPVMLTGANPATHVRVTAALTPTSWGTSIRLTIRGAPLNLRCRLIVRSRAGGTESAGVWDAWSQGPIAVPGSVGWRPSDIASLRVVAGSRTLVTIRATPPVPDRGPAAGRR